MITGIILASGFSRRMDKDKLLLEVEGIPLVERVINTAKSSNIKEFVLIYQKDEIKEIAEKHGIKAVHNPYADEGQSAAVKLGVKSSHPDADGFIFFVGDQPYLNPSTINKLIDEFQKEKDTIVVPLYNGKRGNPVIFPLTLKEELLRLEGDCGGRKIIDSMEDKIKLVTIENGIEGTDIDTEEDYEANYHP